jgi:ADP-ribose pyrophosphatase YjhB (NUDIX family)
MKSAIEHLKRNIENPTKGLPQEIFDFVTSIMPMVNVDLLIKDENNRTLLSWRDDGYQAPGWHVPGGILRYKETLENRVNEVGLNEIGVTLSFDATPLSMNQMICGHSTRGHAISFLYQCFVPAGVPLPNAYKPATEAGYLEWHSGCPENLIPVHEIYRRYI